MPVPRLGALAHSPTLRFTLPVMLENTLTIFIGLVFSRIISTISGSALAAIGMANTVMAVIFSLFSMVTTGAAVLVSRQIGAGEGAAAADTIEQGGFLSLACSAGMTGPSLWERIPTFRTAPYCTRRPTWARAAPSATAPLSTAVPWVTTCSSVWAPLF